MEPFSVCYKAFGRDFHIEPASIQHANAVFQDEYEIKELRQHNVRTIVDIGAHVGSFTVLCHQYWPAAKIVAVEPHPDSFALLQQNTAHIPEDRLLLVNAAITKDSGTTLLSSSVSHSRVGEYVPSLWADLEDRPGNFGVQVPAVTTSDLWEMLSAFGIQQVDLLKLDCEGAEYVVLPELNRLGLMNQVGWLRGEWHCRSSNGILDVSLAPTHEFHIDPNQPHDVGLFLAHRKLA